MSFVESDNEFFHPYHFRAPLSVRCSNGNGTGEYSLPPSYRARNNLSRIPTVMAGTGTGQTGDAPSNMMMSNANESACMAAITETRAIINNPTSTGSMNINASQQHQQQQQHQHQHQYQRQQQQLLQQNSIMSDRIVTPNDTITVDQNGILVADDTVNNTKISHICNVEGGALSLGSKSPISDIDRLFLNSHTSDVGKGHDRNNDSSDESTSRKDLVTIVTISGCTNNTMDPSGEMDILAHL